MIDRHFYTVSEGISLGDLADLFRWDLPTVGSGEEMILSVAPLGDSEPGDVTFFSDPRSKLQLQTANATVCITTIELHPLVAETGMIAIASCDPRADFARVSQRLAREGAESPVDHQIDPTAVVHPTAVLGDGVSIGARTIVGANTVIEGGVSIGADGVIEPLVSVSFAIVGDSCHFKSGAVIGGAGFGIINQDGTNVMVPHFGRVIIGDRVRIGSNSCVDRGQLGDTIIKDNVKIDNLVQIGHNTFIDEGAVIAGHTGVSGSCVIGKNATLAGRASLRDHVTIGDGATLAGNSFAMGNVPAGEVYFGNPAMPIKDQMRHLATLRKLTRRK